MHFIRSDMANKHSKGRPSSLAKRSAGVSTGGPKKTFARTQSKPLLTGKKHKTSQSEVPLSILVVPFHESVFSLEKLLPFLNGLLGSKEQEVDLVAGLRVISGSVANCPKKQFQLMVPNERENLQVVLDAAKVADVLLCLFPAEASYQDSCFDALGYTTLTALRMQGLPVLTVGSVVEPLCKQEKLGTKTVQRYFYSEFAIDKKSKFVTPSATLCQGDQAGLAAQVAGVITAAFTGTLSVANEKSRGYMLIDQLQVSGSEVCMRGFARGAGFGVKSGVVLTGCEETFRVKRIEILDQSSEMEQIIASLEPSQTEIEETLKDLTPLLPEEMQEQTWPTAEEEAEAEKKFAVQMKRVLMPSGANSEMEAAWIGEDMIDDMDEVQEDQQQVDKEEEGDMLSRMFDWDKKIEENEGDSKFEARSREEMDFVDEVDTPEQTPARIRFQRYRGLKSLRNGDWDPYEELPPEYSQIHEFQDAAWAAKQSLAFLKETGKECKNKYAKIYLETVSGNTVPDLAAVAASTVAPFECKMTVVHCRVSRLPETGDLEIKNKQKILVQCGFRRLSVSPLYSEIPKQASSLLQRMHRSLPTDAGSSIMMSFFAPAMFGYTPVLAFDPDSSNPQKLLLWGSVSSCAPNKPIVLKRSTLTGYPFRVHQTKAVCRFMFFNPEDIEWFKPIELSTKKGLRGHIIESLGTHGYMKCRFNGQLTSDDVILLHLYKRVFPKSL